MTIKPERLNPATIILPSLFNGKLTLRRESIIRTTQVYSNGNYGMQHGEQIERLSKVTKVYHGSWSEKLVLSARLEDDDDDDDITFIDYFDILKSSFRTFIF